MNWDYKSKALKSSGYEDLIPLLKTFTKAKFNNGTESEQSIMIDDVCQIYRKRNIFPITYYSNQGIKEEIARCISKKVEFDGDVIDSKFTYGLSLCRFMFSNLIETKATTRKSSNYDKFYDDELLKLSVKYCFKYKNVEYPVLPTSLKDGIEMSGGNPVSNFHPMRAKMLYEKYCPKGGAIFDFSSGFGGRLLGALSSKNKYQYIGVEPNKETYDNLVNLGNEIEAVTWRKDSFFIFQNMSEELRLKKNSFDFIFSSPPYFNLEQYSDDDTQCYIKFPELDDWFEGYVKPTIQNSYDMLKPNSYYAVNMADFNIGNKMIKFVDVWKKYAKLIGFDYIKTIPMKIQKRTGHGHLTEKQEGIFLFKKGDL